MTELFNFTKDKLMKLKPPKAGDSKKNNTYRDAKERGLILVAGYGGSKVFYLYKKIDGKPKRIKLGEFPYMSVEDARDKVFELKRQITKGKNPTKENTTVLIDDFLDKMTFKQFFDKYINDYAKHKIKKWQDVISTVDRQAKHFYNIRISNITRDDIQQVFNKLTMQVSQDAANKFVKRINSIFNKAIEYGWEGKNPTIGITKHKEKSRDRYLISEEIPRFFKALDEEKNQLIKDFVLISLYTGARKSNVLSMNWQNISFENKTWYIADTKNDEPQLVPLVDEAVEILNRRKKEATGEWVFPSKNSKTGHLQEPKKVWYKILQRAGIKDFRLHDLRRTMGSWMAHTGASQYIIGKSLNHKSPHSTAIYARLSIDPVRESMSKASSTINEIRKNDYGDEHNKKDEEQ